MSIAQRFMAAVHEAEATGSVDHLVDLFADDATCASVARGPVAGRDGIRTFWQDYLAQFAHIHSTFEQVGEHEDGCVLEWESLGTLRGGDPIHYRGVSIIENGPDGIVAFRTYYDSAAFVAPISG